MVVELFVGNLPENVDVGQVQVLFDDFNPISIRLRRGYAFVKLEDNAAEAIECLNGEYLYDWKYPIKVEIAKPRPKRNRKGRRKKSGVVEDNAQTGHRNNESHDYDNDLLGAERANSNRAGPSTGRQLVLTAIRKPVPDIDNLSESTKNLNISVGGKEVKSASSVPPRFEKVNFPGIKPKKLIIALDIEWYFKTAGSDLLEIGIAAASSDGDSISNYVVCEHIVIQENMQLCHLNRKFLFRNYSSEIESDPLKAFKYGRSVLVPYAKARERLSFWLTGAGNECPVELVQHASVQDNRVLLLHGIDLKRFTSVFHDTSAKSLYSDIFPPFILGNGNQVKLEDICEAFHLPNLSPEEWHCAGNDASRTLEVYTLVQIIKKHIKLSNAHLGSIPKTEASKSMEKNSSSTSKAPVERNSSSKSKAPVEKDSLPEVVLEKSANTNESSKAQIEVSRLFAKGGSKMVYLGKYVGGKRDVQKCVCKVYQKNDGVDQSFDWEVNLAKKVLYLIHDFNTKGFAKNNRMIKLNLPQVWEFVKGENEPIDFEYYEGRKAMVEPFITKFEKFNSNVGWRARIGVDWENILQALAHYSFHASDGKLLLCDLQGSVDEAEGIIYLTDPVLNSMEQKYGPTDLGNKGISTFFSHHRCSNFCRPDEWKRPADLTRHYVFKEGTSILSETEKEPSTSPLPMTFGRVPSSSVYGRKADRSMQYRQNMAVRALKLQEQVGREKELSKELSKETGNRKARYRTVIHRASR